ncbi:U3 small nucleolar RNA-associated 14 homolog A-like [Paramuricea clavata]|uniref:U3 small nucleolar RNA-associated 14 homolog A-like n=1 Tax=Paramuricea clavata TaxID=317549 RepID=A0A7D9INC1_PARCT|nr:U3 small nucleolar RNA-associated 14 homolog A-like [Paramuricea clavata]
MAAVSELLRLTTRAKKDEQQWLDDNDDKSDSGSEEEVDHEDLLKKIKSLDKKGISKRRKGPLRSELNQNVSEFHLKSEGDDGRVNLGDLVGSLQTSSYHSKLKKSLESLQKMGHIVEVPLAKPAAERIQRVVAYEETSKDIGKWDATVQKNRRAQQLSFPLDAYKPAEMSTTTLATTFKPRTPLEQEIANVLQNSSQMLEREDKELSLEEEEALKNMSLEEALERRHELQKLRALQSYYEQKCRRMKKIKSKKYHRIKRRAEKRANSKQTFEQLQKENPELAQVELEKAEKLRVQERMSLKHRNTSKWAKNIIAKGINDVQARQALSEQLRISRQLTETKTVESDSDEEEGNKAEDDAEIPENFRNFGLVGDSSENPWLLNDGKERENMNEVTEEHENTKERLRKLKAITAEETKEGQGDEDENVSDNSDQDETFELMDGSGAQESGKKRKKRRKKKSIKGKNNDEGSRGKRKKLKGDKVDDIREEGIQKKGKIKGKKKKVLSKGNNEEVNMLKEAKWKTLRKMA